MSRKKKSPLPAPPANMDPAVGQVEAPKKMTAFQIQRAAELERGAAALKRRQEYMGMAPTPKVKEPKPDPDFEPELTSEVTEPPKAPKAPKLVISDVPVEEPDFLAALESDLLKG